MRNILRAFVWAIFTLAPTSVCFSEVASAPSMDPSALPMLIVTYAYDLAYDPTVTLRTGSTLSFLDAALVALNADVPRGLGFVRNVFVIQPAISGNRYASEPDVSTLYVTPPLPTLGNQSLALISSVSPEATTIFTLDAGMHAQLVYNSMTANVFSGGRVCDPMGQVPMVTISSTGALILHERNRHFSNRSARTFSVSITGQSAQVICNGK